MVTLPLLKFTQLDKQISYMIFFLHLPLLKQKEKNIL